MSSNCWVQRGSSVHKFSLSVGCFQDGQSVALRNGDHTAVVKEARTLSFCEPLFRLLFDFGHVDSNGVSHSQKRVRKTTPTLNNSGGLGLASNVRRWGPPIGYESQSSMMKTTSSNKTQEHELCCATTGLLTNGSLVAQQCTRLLRTAPSDGGF